MEIPGGTILTNRALEARLDELRQQRMLLRHLRDDVDFAAGRLTAGDLTGSWRSEAQRGYDRQRSDLAGDLRRAAVLLDAALTEVVGAIDQVGAALAESQAEARALSQTLAVPPGLASAWVPR